MAISLSVIYSLLDKLQKLFAHENNIKESLDYLPIKVYNIILELTSPFWISAATAK